MQKLGMRLVLATMLMLVGTAQAQMCALYPGTMFIFLKPQSALGMGHVAYGFLHGSAGWYGSINGGGPSTNDLVGFTCGTYCSVSPLSMIAHFRSEGYERYAFKSVSDIDFSAALQEARSRSGESYDLLTRNCAHATSAVLKAFGYPFAKSLIGSFPRYALESPNRWFDRNARSDGWTIRSLQ